MASEGQRPFPSGKRLLSHWNLRDQIEADYAEGQAGLVRQRLLRSAIERIVTQEIPRAVIDDPRLDWDPVKNTVVASSGRRGRAPAGRADRQGRGAGGGLRRARARRATPTSSGTSRPRGGWTGTLPRAHRDGPSLPARLRDSRGALPGPC